MFAMLDADVVDNFSLGLDNGSLGDTRVYVATAGRICTLGPNLVLDGTFGPNIQNQEVTGPDYGDNLGLDLGIPGSNGVDVRQRGLPHFAIGTNNHTVFFFKQKTAYEIST